MRDHAKDGREMLLLQFKNAFNLQSLMEALMAQFQRLESELNQVHDGQYIKQAFGRRLDILGKLVGQPRDGMDDGLYRLWIKARILINRSSGTAPELARITQLLLGNAVELRIEEHREVAATITVLVKTKTSLMARVFSLLMSTRPLGVRLFLQHPTNSTFFQFDNSKRKCGVLMNQLVEPV